MNNNIQEFYFFDRNKLYEKLTSVILLNIKNSKKYIALAGGNTPQEFYIYLSNFIKNNQGASHFLATDERWGEYMHAQSNEYLLKTTCLKNFSVPFFSYLNHANSLTQTVNILNKKAFNFNFALNTCLLGMGTDGHFASLFTSEDIRKEGFFISSCAPSPPKDRLSLSFSSICKSEKLILLIMGEEKKKLYEKLKKEKNYIYPISFLLHDVNTPLDIYWAE